MQRENCTKLQEGMGEMRREGREERGKGGGRWEGGGTCFMGSGGIDAPASWKIINNTNRTKLDDTQYTIIHKFS